VGLLPNVTEFNTEFWTGICTVLVCRVNGTEYFLVILT
jgi:hypothetical protein